MTTPGEQFDMNTAAIAKLQGQVASLLQWQASCKCATVDLDPPAEPVQPDPAKPYFDLSGVPDTLTAGELLTVPAIGLPDGAVVWVHSFNRSWQDLEPGEAMVKGERVGFDVPESTGERILQLQSGEVKAHVEVVVKPSVVNPVPKPDPPKPKPPTGNTDIVPADLKSLSPVTWKSFQKWTSDTRIKGIDVEVPGGLNYDWDDWGNFCASNSRSNRLLLEDSRLWGKGHKGQPWKGWGEYYFLRCVFDGLQFCNEANAGNRPGAMIDCDMYNVGEDAIRGLYGHIENVTIHSAKPLPGDPHCDTIHWVHTIENTGLVKNLKSTSGGLHGIITNSVKNLVIDGFEHVHPGSAGWSIMFGGDVENITIRNCKLSGNIQFRAGQKNVNIDWNTVRTNVPKGEFK